MYQIITTITSYMNTPLFLLDFFDTFCLSKKLLRFFLQLTFEARAPVVWGAGEGKHLSQPDVQKEGPLLFLSLESVCGPSAAPLQTAYLSLPGFSHLYCAVVCSPKSRSNGSSGPTHAAGLAQRGVPRDGFNRYGGRERESEMLARIFNVSQDFVYQHLTAEGRFNMLKAGVDFLLTYQEWGNGLAGCWLRLVHWQGHAGAVLPGLEGVLWSNHRKGTCRKLTV